MPTKTQVKAPTGLPPENIPALPEIEVAGQKPKKVNVYGVDYVQVKTKEDGDLFITQWGWPLYEKGLLDPCVWRDKIDSDTRVGATAQAYHIKAQSGDNERDILVRFNRHGDKIDIGVPEVLKPHIKDKNPKIAGPFWEMAQLMKLREHEEGDPNLLFLTQKPFAIYCPPEKVASNPDREMSSVRAEQEHMKKDQAGVSREDRVEYHDDRKYALIYEWAKGEPADVALKRAKPPVDLAEFTIGVIKDLGTRGYSITDIKPNQVIVRVDDDGKLLMRRDKSTGQEQIAYTVVDYELLTMTDEKRMRYVVGKRQRYFDHLERQDEPGVMPEGVVQADIMGRPYMVGRDTAHGGHLMVLGRNPDLYDYFKRDKIHGGKRVRMALRHQLYRCWTTDGIHLVQGISKVCTKPGEQYHGEPRFDDILEHGFNSPWEEFNIAFDLMGRGVEVVRPRAIYIPNTTEELDPDLIDDRRVKTHQGIVLPDGTPILDASKRPSLIYGAWRMTDPLGGKDKGKHWGMTDLEVAAFNGVVSESNYDRLLWKTHQDLRSHNIDNNSEVRIENYAAENVLLMYDEKGDLRLDRRGEPQTYIVMDARRAHQHKMVSDEQYQRLVKRETEKLNNAGYECLERLERHILVPIAIGVGPVTDNEGVPIGAHCLFDTYRKIKKD